MRDPIDTLAARAIAATRRARAAVPVMFGADDPAVAAEARAKVDGWCAELRAIQRQLRAIIRAERKPKASHGPTTRR
jgi:hypothetical protein